MNHGNRATTMCKAECYWSFVVRWGEFGHVTVHSLFLPGHASKMELSSISFITLCYSHQCLWVGIQYIPTHKQALGGKPNALYMHYKLYRLFITYINLCQ